MSLKAKSFRFIGTHSSIAGRPGLKRFGQKVMFTAEEAAEFVNRRGGVPCVSEEDWDAAWKGFSHEVERPDPQRPGKTQKKRLTVADYSTPASHLGAPSRFGTIKAELAGKYVKSVADADARRVVEATAEKPVAKASSPDLADANQVKRVEE